MSAIITAGEHVIAPTILLGIESSRAAGNIVHPIIGRRIPDVTLRAAAARTGRVLLGFEGPDAESASATAEALLGDPLVFTVVSDERATLSLSFVVHGQIERELDDATRDAWTVSAEYQEVDA